MGVDYAPAVIPRITATKSARVTFGLLLIGSIILLAVVILPIWKPIFLAVVLAAALWPVNQWFVRKFGNRHRLASALTTILLVVVILGPVTGLIVTAITEAIDTFQSVRTMFEQGGIAGMLARLPDWLERPLTRAIQWLPSDVESVAAQALTRGEAAVGLFGSVLTGITGLAFDLILMLIVFHTLLERGDHLLAWILRVSPLPETNELLVEARQTSGFVLRSSFLTALVQGTVATIGFFIASVPNPLFFGMLALFAAFIPSVGTALVTLPMIVLLVLSGDVWQPIFLTIWSVLAIGLVDNILKPLLIKNGVRLNGVVIFIALVGGMFVFGAIGLIIGPLAVTTFLSMVRFMYREYVERPQPTVVTSVTAELVACTGPAKEATENPHKQKEGPESPSLQTT
jgi:predicted PurR-regulated permease PerM